MLDSPDTPVSWRKQSLERQQGVLKLVLKAIVARPCFPEEGQRFHDALEVQGRAIAAVLKM